MDSSDDRAVDLRSTRRTVVRAAAWTAPAVMVATTAPPASAASGQLFLEVDAGGSYAYFDDDRVVRDGASLVLSGFRVTPRGGSVQPGELFATVSFAPTPPSTANLLTSFHVNASGWQFPAASHETTVFVPFGGALASGQYAEIDAQLIYCDFDVMQEHGSFVVSMSAPAAGFTTPVVRTFAVPQPALTLDAGQSHSEISSTDKRFQLVFDGLEIGLSGAGTIPAENLQLTVTFDPAAPTTRTALDPLNKDADPWGYDRTASDVQEVIFTYQQPLAAGQKVEFPFGPYLDTQFPDTQQAGSFVLTATAPGCASATAKVAADPKAELVYETGTSYVAPAIDGGWQVNFEGARVAPSTNTPPVGPLTMVATFEATGGFTNVLQSTGPMPGWSSPPQGSTATSMTYTSNDALAAGGPTAIPDGAVFRNNSTNPGSTGTFRLDFSSPGELPASHEYVVPPPYVTATFDPGGNRAYRQPTYYFYDWAGDARLRVQGGSLPAGALAMTVTFEPASPADNPYLDFSPFRFTGWSLPFPTSTVAASGQYVYQSPVGDGEVLTLGPSGDRFATLGKISGTFVIRFSSLVATTPRFLPPAEFRVPTPRP